MRLPRVIFVLALGCLPAVSAAAPRDDLLRVVPSDYTFCVLVQNLRDQGKPGSASFLQKLAESPLFKQFQQSPEAQKVQQVFQAIFKELGVTPEQLRDDILGDALVFAFRKGPPGQPEKDDGLIMLHARDAKLLARLVDRINELQTKGGELKAVEKIDGKSGPYFRRVKAGQNESADFYALTGNRLVFSGSESLLKSTLVALAKKADGQPALVQRMKRLGVAAAPIVCLINPRSFDAEVAHTATTGKGSEQAFLREFARYWKAVDGLAVSLNLTPDFELGLSLNIRKTDLPPAAAKFLTEAGKRSPLWDRVPDDALFAAVGRIQPESLATMLGAFLTENDRTKVVDTVANAARPFLETEDLAPLLKGIGPDIGFWVSPPDPTENSWCPQAILAIKTSEQPEGKQAEQAALKGLDFLTRLACLSDKQLRVHTEKQGPNRVQYLTHATAFPPGFRPAFASKSGYILIAGSPRTVARFEPPSGPAGCRRSPHHSHLGRGLAKLLENTPGILGRIHLKGQRRRCQDNR